LLYRISCQTENRKELSQSCDAINIYAFMVGRTGCSFKNLRNLQFEKIY